MQLNKPAKDKGMAQPKIQFNKNNPNQWEHPTQRELNQILRSQLAEKFGTLKESTGRFPVPVIIFKESLFTSC